MEYRIIDKVRHPSESKRTLAIYKDVKKKSIFFREWGRVF